MKQYLPNNVYNIIELFSGSLAVSVELFNLRKRELNIIAFDTNKFLINLYEVTKKKPELLVEGLHEHMQEFRKRENYISKSEYYYRLVYSFNNDLQNHKKGKWFDPVDNAIKFFVINYTSFNSVYRENRKGVFNVPFSDVKTETFVNRDKELEIRILKFSEFLNRNITSFVNSDFTNIFRYLKENKIQLDQRNTLFYFDPPYDHSEPKKSGFKEYTHSSFNILDQKDVFDVFRKLTRFGYNCIVSNSNSRFIMELYKDYDIKEYEVKRLLNCIPNKRKEIFKEVLIKNY